MPRLVAPLCLGFVLWLVAAGLAPAAPRGERDPVDPQRQVLVMLRLPPAHLRPSGDYGGAWSDGAGHNARRRIASRLAHENGLILVDDWPMPLVGVDCYVLDVPPGQSPTEVSARLSRSPDVAWAQPMNLYRGEAEATHNDPLYRTQPAAREWRLAALHQVATGRNVRVAVVDSMIEAAHPDLIGQIETRQNFVSGHANAPEQHGTAVAGIIAARADNGIGIAGVAPGARLMALRACWQQATPAGAPQVTLCDSLSLAKALDFAIMHQARVVNMSLSGPPDTLLGKLLDAARTRRIVVVAAFDRDLPGGGFPASHTGVVAVADESWGAVPAGVYSAPGDDVPTTTPGGHWALVNGSSFAAAHVSGLIALLRERYASSPSPLKLVAWSPTGGVIDACASLLGAAPPCAPGRIQIRQAAAIIRR